MMANLCKALSKEGASISGMLMNPTKEVSIWVKLKARDNSLLRSTLIGGILKMIGRMGRAFTKIVRQVLATTAPSKKIGPLALDKSHTPMELNLMAPLMDSKKETVG